MEYLFDNPRTLFVLLLLILYSSMALSLVIVFRIFAMIRKAKQASGRPGEHFQKAAQADRRLEDENACCPGSAPHGACPCP